jgi:hypothetical protein
MAGFCSLKNKIPIILCVHTALEGYAKKNLQTAQQVFS